MIVNDINEIWSLDLAYVVEFAKYNRDVQYLLVAVDCLSRYFWVEPQKLKYAKQTTETFKKKRSKKYDLIEKSSNTILTAKKKSAFAERNIRLLKSIIYKYLEFEVWMDLKL